MRLMELLASVWVQALLWAIAVAAAIWILGPAIGFALSPRRIGADVCEDPGLAEPRGKDPAYEGRFRELAALGFVPVGEMIEKAWFFTPLHWFWRGDGTRVFASPDRTVFVSLYRFGGADPLRVSVETIFEEGGALVTLSPGFGQRVLTDKDRLVEAGETDVATLVEKHRKHVQDFIGPRVLTVKPTTFREFAAESAAFSERTVTKSKLSQMYAIHSIFGMPLLMLVPARAILPAGTLPLLICVLAAMFAAIRWTVLPARVPMFIRVVVMSAVVALPLLGFVRWSEARSEERREIAAILDRVEADAEAGRPAQGVDGLVARGTRPCRSLVYRLESEETRPKARRALHDILVRIKGSDLGEAPAPWRAWCESTGERIPR
jgi:hypothetical protein